MTPIQAILLGVIQGVTEFLPISSDGHLVVAQSVLGLTTAPVFFDVFVHTATLLAMTIFFWTQLLRLKFSYLKLILLSLIPTGIIGLFFNRWIGQLYTSLPLASAGFLVTALFLFLSRGRNETKSLPSALDAVFIGIVQGFAVLPGWSRSGSTIALALLLGVNRRSAFTFSFLAAIPAIIGAQLVQLADLPADGLSVNYLVGFIAAGLTGLLSLKLLERIVATRHFYLFGGYALFISIVTLTLAYVL